MYWYNYYKESLKTIVKALLNDGLKKSNSNYLDLGIINPSIGTSNLGDFIIYESVIQELRDIYKYEFFTNFPSQLGAPIDAKRLMGEKDFLFVSGTNLLSSNMDKQYQWKIDPIHKLFLKNNVILMGVGWWQYQEKPNKYTINLYKKLFDTDHLHSVRDSYTCNMLNDIGIKNVVNTTCPTLWKLSENHCSLIPTNIAQQVVTTLTFYKSNEELDKRLLEILVNSYDKVYLWVQGLNDVKYLKSIFLDWEKIELIPPTLEAFDLVLNNPSIDYLGTRLHAGVRAIQKGKRTLIVAVDNRAIEIGKDTNLNVISRENVEEVYDFIKNDYKTKINLPIENIKEWKNRLP